MLKRWSALASGLALAVGLGTCAYDGGNLCPLQCFEDDCCDPVCRPAPKLGSACTAGQTLCTYRGFDLWASYECVGGEVQCGGTMVGCCPSQPPSGACSMPGLRCRYEPSTLCLCDGPFWHCFDASLDLSAESVDAGGD